MKFQFTYKSVHQYLSLVLSEYASDEDIRKAKEKYWRMRNSEYQRFKRELKKHITLAFDKEDYNAVLKNACELELNVYDYLRTVGIQTNMESLLTKKYVRSLEIQILDLTESIDECLDELDNSELEVELREKCLQLEQTIEQLTTLG